MPSSMGVHRLTRRSSSKKKWKHGSSNSDRNNGSSRSHWTTKSSSEASCSLKSTILIVIFLIFATATRVRFDFSDAVHHPNVSPSPFTSTIHPTELEPIEVSLNATSFINKTDDQLDDIFQQHGVSHYKENDGTLTFGNETQQNVLENEEDIIDGRESSFYVRQPSLSTEDDDANHLGIELQLATQEGRADEETLSFNEAHVENNDNIIEDVESSSVSFRLRKRRPSAMKSIAPRFVLKSEGNPGSPDEVLEDIYPCNDTDNRVALPEALMDLLDFDVNVRFGGEENHNVLFMGDSSARQIALHFASSSISTTSKTEASSSSSSSIAFPSPMGFRIPTSTHNNNNNNNSRNIVFYRVHQLESKNADVEESMIEANPYDYHWYIPENGWYTRDIQKILQANNNNMISFRTVISRINYPWIYPSDVTMESLQDQVEIIEKWFAPSTIIFLNAHFCNNVMNDPSLEEFQNANEQLQQFATLYNNKNNSSSIVLIADLSNFVYQVHGWYAKEVLHLNVMSNSTTNTAIGSDLIHSGPSPPCYARGMRNAANSRFNLKYAHICGEEMKSNDDDDMGDTAAACTCKRNALTNDGMHFCMEHAMGPRMTASLACMMQCSDDVDRDNQLITTTNWRASVEACAQRCNEQFLSLKPIPDEHFE